VQFSEEAFKEAFKNTQATLAIEGLELPDDMYEVYKKVLKREISEEEFLEIAKEYANS
jgi:hypothetical protein